MAVQSPDRAAEGYAKQVFGATDATTLAEGVAVIGPQATGTGGVPIVEIFTAILMELRSINANIMALREPSNVSTNLLNQ